MNSHIINLSPRHFQVFQEFQLKKRQRRGEAKNPLVRQSSNSYLSTSSPPLLRLE